MSTQVLIRDHLAACTHEFLFMSADKLRMDALCDRDDRLLAQFQNRPQFAGRKRWCDLEQEQFRILIVLHVALLADLPLEKRSDPENPIARSLSVVLLGLCRLIEQTLAASITLITINRVSEDDLTFDLTLSLEPFALPRPRQAGLRIVVDNSR